MTLYEIAQDYQIFLEQIEAGEIPEEAVEDTLDSMAGEFREKADQIACVIKNLRAEAAAYQRGRSCTVFTPKSKGNTGRSAFRILKDSYADDGDPEAGNISQPIKDQQKPSFCEN